MLLLIVANGAFAMAEAAIVASRRARLEGHAASGDHGARVALELSDDPNTFLSTVQVGITLIGVFAGAFGGASLAEPVSEFLEASVPILAPYADSVAFGLVVAIITYLSLIIGELVPKRLALNAPENVASRVAPPMRLISKIAAPIVSFLAWSTNVVLRILRVKASDEAPVSEEEVKVMISQGADAGVFEATESRVIERVFALTDRRVSTLMTRRPEIVWLDSENEWPDNAAILAQSPYSRALVGRGGIDKIEGVVRAKELLSVTLRGESVALENVMAAPIFVPESMSAWKFLEVLREKRAHIAVVVDDLGSTQGVITLHDVLESLVGDLPGLDESGESYATPRDDGSWLCDGLLPLEDLWRLLNVRAPLHDELANVETLSGLVLRILGRIPHEGDTTTLETADGEITLEIVDMDGPRVDKVLVRRSETEPSQG